MSLLTHYRSWWRFYNQTLSNPIEMRYINRSYFLIHLACMNWLSCNQKRTTKKSLHTMTTRPRLLQSNRCWTAKSNLYFEISQLLSYSCFASLMKLQLYIFPGTSVRKTCMTCMYWVDNVNLNKDFQGFPSLAYYPRYVTAFCAQVARNLSQHVSKQHSFLRIHNFNKVYL